MKYLNLFKILLPLGWLMGSRALGLTPVAPNPQVPDFIEVIGNKGKDRWGDFRLARKWITGHFLRRDGHFYFVTSNKVEYEIKTSVNPAELKAAYVGDIQLQFDQCGVAKLTPDANSFLQECYSSMGNISGKMKSDVLAAVGKIKAKLDEPVPPGESAKKKANEAFYGGAVDILQAFIDAPETEKKANLDAVGLMYYSMLKWAERGNGRDKANFGPDDNYPPESYSAIQKTSAGVGAIRHSKRVVGTVFHLGNNILLTAEHCLWQDAENHFEVSKDQMDFCFSSKPDPAVPDRNVPFGTVLMRGREGDDPKLSEGDDFVIIRADSDSKRTPETLNVPALSWTPMPVGRYSSVYVLGYKNGGDMTVVDGAHVLFPHEFNIQEYYDLKLRLAAELQIELWDANAVPVKAGKEADRKDELATLVVSQNELRRKFEDSLLPDPQTNPPSKWLLQSSFVKLPAMPAFGLDSNTFGGAA